MSRLDRYYQERARRQRWERGPYDPQNEPDGLPEDDDLFQSGDPLDDLDPRIDYDDRDHCDRERGT